MKSILLSLITLFSLNAMANTDETVVIESRKTIVEKDSSEHMRMNKKITVQWQLFGSGANGTSQSAIIAGYHLDRNSIIQLEAGGGGNSFRTFFSSSEYSYNSYSVGAHFKKFLGNSFYVKTGVDYRSVDYVFNYGYSSVKTGFEGNSLAASLVIGNQWQWDNFTLGCDWIGLSLPFAHTVTSETLSADADSYHRANLDEDEEHYLKNGYAQALRFYVGYSF
ncbi:hypothetical protein [Bdellovibrio bacteriovorus]|uniref:hypothetical protein n=1 Tax=Bdellovibrio TaxID=958 RepID=UPI0035A96DB6